MKIGLYNVTKIRQKLSQPMSSESHTIAITIAFIDPELTPTELNEEAIRLLEDLGDLRDIEAVDRVRDPNPPEGNKSIGGFLTGMLLAEVSTANVKKVLGFLGDRLIDKPISFEVKGNGKELKVTASSRAELEAAVQLAKDFIEA